MIIARVKVLNTADIISPEITFRNQKVHAADISIDEIFHFQWEDGSVSGFDNSINHAIISASTSLQHFGTVEGSGNTIGIRTGNDTLHFSVAGVYKDFPENSHERFDIFIPFDNSTLSALHFNPARSGAYARIYRPEESWRNTLEKRIAYPQNITYHFQSLSQIYFGPRVTGEDARHGDYYSITILIAITLLILFLALATFINLTTLTLPHRAKEIAVKKLAGIGQRNLNLGFAIESLVIVFASSVIGLTALALFSGFFASNLSIDVFSLLSRNILVLAMVCSVFFLLFGLAPLVMVLRFTGATPNRLLSTDTITFPQLKRIITFFQLGISMFLIVASMVLGRQINYSLIKEPGRNYDQVVYLSYPNEMTEEGLRSLRSAWNKYHPNIIDVMASSQRPDDIKSKEINSPFYFMSVDPAFIDFFRLNMLHGNWFKANAGDTSIVMNRRGMELSGDANANLIGVYEDMSERFNQPEKPLKINIARYYDFNYLFIRILEVDIRRTVGYLENHFKIDDHTPTVSFLDKNFERWLKYQDGLNTLSGILAIISGLLSCFAIYGLSISLVRHKLKQIALHKLFGASTFRITRLLLRAFSRQALIALLVFAPLSYLILKELLRKFVYTTPFTWGDAIFPLLYCAIVIFILCGFQARSLNRQDLTGALKS